MLKAAVIGTGVISKEHLSFLSDSERAELVGVCDLSPVSAQYAAERYGARQAYTDMAKMLDDAKPDVVHILTPPHTHKIIAETCLQAGAHVICEKPVASSAAEFEELWAVAKRCGRHLIEDQNYRFNDPIIAINKMVEQGVLGDIKDVDIRLTLKVRDGGPYANENLKNPIHQMPAGVIHDFVTHMVYLAADYLPSFDQVSALWSNHGGGELFKYDDLDALVVGGDVHAHLRFNALTAPEGFAVAVRGSEGYVETDLFQPYLKAVIPRAGGGQLSPLANQFVNGFSMVKSSFVSFRNKVMQHTPYHGLARLLDKTYAAISAGEEPPIRYQDMQRTCQLIDLLVNSGGER